MQDDLIERLDRLIEKQRNARGDYLDKGEADSELVDARARIAALEADNARLMGLVETAAAAERGRIVAWLQELTWSCADDMTSALRFADAIERGEV